MSRDRTRQRILETAADLLKQGGRDAVSTRAVCLGAGVQSPTIYRIFRDKDDLLDAVASRGFETYLADKTGLEQTDDPVADLRRGWDLHIGFGLANPALYALIYGDARVGVESPAARQASAVLAGQIRRIAEAGRLRVTESAAAHLIHSAGCGMTFTLISIPPDERDLGLSAMARESAIAAITTDATPTDERTQLISLAVAMRAVAPQLTRLSPTEQALLVEWMDRTLAAGGGATTASE